MSINLIYNRLYGGEPVSIECSRATYDTIRTNLIKKHGASARLLSDIGDESMLDTYVSATFNKATNAACFEIKPVADKKRKAISFKFL